MRLASLGASLVSTKNGAGSITLRCDTPEDMWHTYNLISLSDEITTTTHRKIVKESATGSTSSSKVRITLKVLVEKIEFDDQAITMRIGGKNQRKSDHVSMNAYHTLELELNKNFTIEKDCWDTILLERADTACNPSKYAEIAAVVMHNGLAHLCLITDYMTITRAKIEMSIPRKRAGNSTHGKQIVKFYEAIYQAILRHIDLKTVKVVLLASPGFVKDDFFTYLKTESVRNNERSLIEQANRNKFVLCRR